MFHLPYLTWTEVTESYSGYKQSYIILTWKKHRDLTVIWALIENTSLETILEMFHLPNLSWTEVTESDSG